MSEIRRHSPREQGIPAGLHLVATPIGTARDITLRALDVLAGADVLAAEDTRTLRHLMEIHGISLNGRPLIAVHDHNEMGVSPRIIAAISEGKSVAYASEAGTPLVSDPGFVLARAVGEAGLKVHAVPGASAVLAALMVAGLPTDRFMFAGFIPQAAGERNRFLNEMLAISATVVLYESPRRIIRTLNELVELAGPDRRVAMCRELTKRFEQVLRGTLSEVIEALGEEDPKGEVVLVIDRAPEQAASEENVELALKTALKTMRVKDAAAFVAQTLDVPRRQVYQMALDLAAQSKDQE